MHVEANQSAFSIAEKYPPQAGLTISTTVEMTGITKVTHFSLGKNTEISREAYINPVIYLGAQGSGTYLLGEDATPVELKGGEILILQSNTLCGVHSNDGFVYTEILPGKEIVMNEAIKAGEGFVLKDLVPYKEDSVVNMDVVSNGSMKFVVMAFDDGQGLSPHKAPGDALVFALEGNATVTYENEDYEFSEGQAFRFAKNGLHALKANGRFKMALLLTLE